MQVTPVPDNDRKHIENKNILRIKRRINTEKRAFRVWGCTTAAERSLRRLNISGSTPGIMIVYSFGGLEKRITNIKVHYI